MGTGHDNHGLGPRVGFRASYCSRVSGGWGAGFVYKRGGRGDLLALRPTHPKKIWTQNLAEGKSNLNQRPFVGPPQTPPPPY